MSYKNIKNRILILDKQNASLRALLETSAKIGINAKVAMSLSAATYEIKKSYWDMIFIADDFIDSSEDKANDETVVDPIIYIHSLAPTTSLVVISDEDDSKNAINAIKSGAANFLPRPIDKKRLLEIISNKKEKVAKKKQPLEITHSSGCYYMVGSSEKIRKLIQTAQKVAKTRASVMLSGPNGTGKELVAQLIHNNSKRANNNFIKLNCAALSESLLQSELFGHERGSFTGALTTRKGKFERANHGTILLDEITETSLAFQSQLLRVLEQGSIERVGGDKEIALDLRVICTTNKNIHEQIRLGKFREDLYYRLSTITINLPPLKDRKEDILELVSHFIDIFAGETDRIIKKIDKNLLEVFEKYSWPGNIRQLRNAVHSCLILGDGPILSLVNTDWIDQDLLCMHRAMSDNNSSVVGQSLRELEKQAILATLEHSEGNQTKAAKLLGITNRTLRDKIKRYRDTATASDNSLRVLN